MKGRRSGRLFTVVVVAAVLCAVVAVAAPAAPLVDAGVGHYRGFGDAGGFRNVLPPGQRTAVGAFDVLAGALGTPPPHANDQVAMYEGLVRAGPTLTEGGVDAFFKDASFGVRPADVARVYSPTPGVTVVRDRFGVPHIYGATREATMFAQGYTGAEDRLFFMDVLRHVGRARASQFLGPSPENQAMDRAQLAVAPYRNSDLTRQVDELGSSGLEGAAVVADFLAYAKGVSAYVAEALVDPSKLPAEYAALQQLPRAWTVEDTVAVASFVAGRLGRGGGREVVNLCGLRAIAEPPDGPGDEAQARAVFDDLRFADDPESPTTAADPFPYPTGLGTVDPASRPDLDCASLAPVGGGTESLADLLEAAGNQRAGVRLTAPFGTIELDLAAGMSNAVLVAGSRTATGRPIAVFGPQTGYFSPQALVEKDVHGPGIDARGVAFPGTDMYVLMGRGPQFAWSATSSGADNVDQVVLRLCDPGGGPATMSSMGELRRHGVCVPLEGYQHVQVAKPTLAGMPAGPDVVLSWRVERSRLHGPVVARGRLEDGTPVAVASRRSTYGAELASAVGFRRLNDPASMAGGFPAFRQAVAAIDYTFNWFYVDSGTIGYQHSCKCPVRAPGVDPDLPAWGTGPWDWQGFVDAAQQPWAADPTSGYLTSWNNRQAPGFRSADDDFSRGPVYRSQLLDRRIEAAIAAGGVDRAAVVRAMIDAATVDLRGERNLSLVLEVLGTEPPVGTDPRAVELRNRLASWLAAGTHRRDLDGDGAYDDPFGPAAIDAWWGPLVRAVFDPESWYGRAVNDLRLKIHDPPQAHLGSAFQGAMYAHVDKDLRRVLGKPVAGPWSRTYCGGGDLTACQQALWHSLTEAAKALEAEFGSASPDDWRRRPADDEIRFSAVGLTPVAPMVWMNRPTFQQVVQVGAG